jgi:hypothetical protein
MLAHLLSNSRQLSSYIKDEETERGVAWGSAFFPTKGVLPSMKAGNLLDEQLFLKSEKKKKAFTP